MRVGDFSVEIVAAGGGAREIESGHVLARPGQVYTLRLRNHGPLRAVADVSIDGHTVTGGGLVLNAWSATDLERPIHESERGRFTVIAEGDEHVFGPDGGRDNPNLGLIEARFRRELPESRDERVTQAPQAPGIPRPIVPFPPAPRPNEPGDPRGPGSPRWTPPAWNGPSSRLEEPLGTRRRTGMDAFLDVSAPLGRPGRPAHPAESTFDGDAIERAAGTGLTGSSLQDFVPVHVGPLELEATVIRLRIVIGTEEALSAPRPLPESDTAPARPAARP